MWRRLLTIFIVMLFAPHVAQAACISPAGAAGEITYNADSGVPQYCDDTNWIAMTGASSGSGASCPTFDSCPVDSGIFQDCTGSVLASASTTLAACQTQCESWVATYGYQCCEHNSGTCSYKDGSPTLNFTVGHYGAACYQFQMTGTEGSGQYCYYVDDNTDGTTKSFCTAQVGSSNQECSTTVIPGSTLCIYGDSGASDLCYDYNSGGPNCHSFGDTGVVNGHRLTSYQGNGSGDGDGSLCPGGYSSGGGGTTTEVVPSGLVGHWRLDETSGTTTADSSGNGYDGTLSGGVTYQPTGGISGGAAQFDGVNGRIDLGNLDVATGDITLTAWIKADTFNTVDPSVIAKADGIAEANYYWTLRFPSAAGAQPIQSRIKASGTTDTNNSTGTVPTGDWVHVAITYDQSATGSEISYYINGALDSTDPHTLGAGAMDNNASVPVAIGNIPTAAGGERPFDGLIDEVRVYDRALSATEIQEIYLARDGIRYNEAAHVPEYFDGNKWAAMIPPWPGVTDGLVGHWKLDETSGTTAADSTSNGNDGTLSGDDFSNRSIVGAIGGGFTFNDGSTTTLTIPGDTSYATSIGQSTSYSIWFRTNSTVGGDIFLLDEWSGNERASLRITSSKTSLWGGFRDTNLASASGSFASGENLNDGQWRHAVFIVNRNTNQMRAYINGVEIGTPVDISGLTGASIGFNDTNVTVGSSATHLADVDDIRIYDRELSATEIQELYNMGAPVGQNTALPQGCPNIGDVCDDGTVYAGLSPDGNVPMYTTVQDGTFGLYWNDGSTNFTTVDTWAGVDGYANTIKAVMIDANSGAAGFQEHEAPSYCYNLNSHGASDWYLPSWDELREMCLNKDVIPNFVTSGGGAFVYWDSTDTSISEVYNVRFDTCGANTDTKNASYGSRSIRCVRKGPAPRCANPYGIEGAMLYNADHTVVQYCDGARWISIGKRQ